MLGGDPVGLLRLSSVGAAVLDRVLVGGGSDTPAESRLVDRLVDRGVLVPEPTSAEARFAAGDVSVVVPVRDDAEGVARLLDSLAAAGDALAEVIVVDDGSADAASLATVVGSRRGLATRLVRREHSGGPAAARNDGAAAARSPLLAFLDADCAVAPGWLDPLLGHFDDDRVAVVAPRVVAAPAASRRAAGRSSDSGWGPAAVWGVDRFRSPLDLGGRAARVAPGRRVSYVPSAAMLVRAESFDQVGGFDASMRVGEDVDLVWRLVESGRTVRYEPAASVAHEVRPDVVSFLRQRVGYGSSAAALDERHPGRVAPARLTRWSALVAAGLLVGGPGCAGRRRTRGVDVVAVARPARRGPDRTGAAARRHRPLVGRAPAAACVAARLVAAAGRGRALVTPCSSGAARRAGAGGGRGVARRRAARTPPARGARRRGLRRRCLGGLRPPSFVAGAAAVVVVPRRNDA